MRSQGVVNMGISCLLAAKQKQLLYHTIMATKMNNAMHKSESDAIIDDITLLLMIVFQTTTPTLESYT